MPLSTVRPDHGRGHWLAVAALLIAVIVSIAAVVSFSAAGGPTPLEAAGISYPTESPDAQNSVELSYSGVGNRVLAIELPDGSDELAVAAITYDGSRRFVVTGHSRDGVKAELMVDTSGSYRGTVLFNRARTLVESLQITAKGAWTITLLPVREVPEMSGGMAQGFGDAVVVYRGPAGSAVVTDDGPGYFALSEFSASGHLVVHEHGPYAGTVRWDAGPTLLSISSEGNWTISVATS